jgi:hypothetical protein
LAGVDDAVLRAYDRRIGFEEQQRLLGDLVAELGGVFGIVPADTNDFAAGYYGSEQAYVGNAVPLTAELDLAVQGITLDRSDNVLTGGRFHHAKLRFRPSGEPRDAHEYDITQRIDPHVLSLSVNDPRPASGQGSPRSIGSNQGAPDPSGYWRVGVLTADEWRARAAAHAKRVGSWTAEHLARRRRGEAHPIWDFLFTYYSYRPAQLRRWHSGLGIVLEDADERLSWDGYVRTPDGVTVDVAGLTARQESTVQFVGDLLAGTASRPANYRCFGLHEWAMVYRAETVRHGAWPLRLGQAGTNRVVETHRIGCSHFDAYRFFTPAAAPRNGLRPTRESQPMLEQPGCLHASMDLYKWAYKLQPLTPSELVADCFALARDIRMLDMQASPYDLTDLGVEPLRIETAEGKAAYVAAQRAFVERAMPLRRRLIALCEEVLQVGSGVAP